MSATLRAQTVMRNVVFGGSRLLILKAEGTIIRPLSPAVALHINLRAMGSRTSILTDQHIAQDAALSREVHLARVIHKFFGSATMSSRKEAISMYPHQQLRILQQMPELSQAAPHTFVTLEALRARFDMQIMLTSGFPRIAFDYVLERLAAQSIEFDFNICSSEASSQAGMLRMCLAKSKLEQGCFVADTRKDMEVGRIIKNVRRERALCAVGMTGNSAEGELAHVKLASQADVVIQTLPGLLDLKYFRGRE
jgi:hypothetical protein